MKTGPNRTSHGADAEGIIWVVVMTSGQPESIKSPPIPWVFLAHCGQATDDDDDDDVEHGKLIFLPLDGNTL